MIVCLLSAGDGPNARRLTDDEREMLEIRAKVSDGSSGVEIDLSEIVKALATNLVDKMDPITLTITILGLAIIIAGRSSFVEYLSSRRKERLAQSNDAVTIKQLESQEFQSKEETKRIELLTSVISEQQPRNAGRSGHWASESPQGVRGLCRHRGRWDY